MVLRRRYLGGSKRYTNYRSGSKRRPFIRRSLAIRRPVAVNLDRRIRRINKMVELKSHSFLLEHFIDNNGWESNICNAVAVGTDETSRIGDTVHWTSIRCNFRLITHELSTHSTVCRVIVFWDRQANGTTPSVSGTSYSLLDSSQLDDNSQYVNIPYNYNARLRYKVIYDRLHVTNPITGATIEDTAVNYTSTRIIKFKRRLSRRTVYNADTASIDSVVTNSLWITVIGDTSATYAPQLVGFCKLYFKDP